MHKIDWAIDEIGGRAIEVPYIRQHLAGIKNYTIADYGCMENGNGGDDIIGTNKYLADTQNTFIYFDLSTVSKLQGKYHQVDFTQENFYPPETIDIGICVSVLEHIGLNVYANKLNPNGDVQALQNIYKTIKKNGKLHLTIPISDIKYNPVHWIRSYTIQEISEWRKIISYDFISIRIFKKIKAEWYECINLEELGRVRHYEGNEDITGVACVTIIK